MAPEVAANGRQPEAGLRERKKRRTRQALIDAALRLYREHGFEGVTVARIASEADVAPRTFFGYFESKEDVFLGRGDDRIEQLVRAIRERDRSQAVLTAVRPVLLPSRSTKRQRADPDSGNPELSDLLRHPAVAARLRERWNRWEDRLAEAIAEDVGAGPFDPEPRVVAAALTGAIRVAALAAQAEPTEARRRELARRALEILESGLAHYGAQVPRPAAGGAKRDISTGRRRKSSAVQ
jgi:AcrR family transcriptional regulator